MQRKGLDGEDHDVVGTNNNNTDRCANPAEAPLVAALALGIIQYLIVEDLPLRGIRSTRTTGP